MNFYVFVIFRGGGGGLAFFCQKTWGVAYTRGAAYTSEYGSTEYRLRSTEYNLKCSVHPVEYRIYNTAYRLLNTEYREGVIEGVCACDRERKRENEGVRE